MIKKIFKIIMIIAILALLSACVVLYVNNNPKITGEQFEILKVLLIIMLISVLYCFIVGELTLNNSQMDKLWSITPIIYAWVIAGMGGMSVRLIIMAILVSLWGIRLTYNFYKKGAYKLKFWQGEEDYRWKLLRTIKPFNNRIVWGAFDLFFISFYQNFLVLLIVLPMLLCVGNTNLNWIDFVSMGAVLFFIIYEMVADKIQWDFQSKKYEMLNSGKKLEELPYPYNLGFNTIGIWNRSRHPNYFAEQAVWVSFYFFSVASGLEIFNYTAFGALLLILLFMGSSQLQEAITKRKYPLYEDYINNVNKYIPFKKYRKD